MTRPVGLIGLGAMGIGVARSLLRAGFRVHACDLRQNALDAFAAEGGTPCATPAELGAQCEVVVTLVVNAEQTEAVLFGENGVVSRMKSGGVVIASATVSPAYAVTLGIGRTDTDDVRPGIRLCCVRRRARGHCRGDLSIRR